MSCISAEAKVVIALRGAEVASCRAQPKAWKLEALDAVDGPVAATKENESTRVSRPEAGLSDRFPHLARASLSRIFFTVFSTATLVGPFCFIVDHGSSIW